MNNSLTFGSSSLLYHIWRFSSIIINISMLLLLLTTPCAWRIKEKLWHHIPFFLTNFVNHLINPGLIKLQLIKLNFRGWRIFVHTIQCKRTRVRLSCYTLAVQWTRQRHCECTQKHVVLRPRVGRTEAVNRWDVACGLYNAQVWFRVRLKMKIFWSQQQKRQNTNK